MENSEEISKITRKQLTLKYFGNESNLNGVIEKAISLVASPLDIEIDGKYGDYAVKFFYDVNCEKDANCVIRYVVSELKDDIYAETDESLSERLFDLLKLKKMKLSVAESFTGGRVVSAVISNSGASEILHEGIVCYSNKSKADRLNVKGQSLAEHGAVSSIVAYEMAVGLLSTGNCDIAISTTGLAGPNSDDSEKPVGLCYIGVGTNEGVDTYKFNFVGDREEITETAKNTALFLAIKKLKTY